MIIITIVDAHGIELQMGRSQIGLMSKNKAFSSQNEFYLCDNDDNDDNDYMYNYSIRTVYSAFELFLI